MDGVSTMQGWNRKLSTGMPCPRTRIPRLRPGTCTTQRGPVVDGGGQPLHATCLVAWTSKSVSLLTLRGQLAQLHTSHVHLPWAQTDKAPVQRLE